MSSVSGLGALHRRKARKVAKGAALLSLHHASEVHYTQGAQRWEGIAKGLKAWRGQYPNYMDCSAGVTWWLWNGLAHFKVRDVVNGQGWLAGYTGTMRNHGKRVRWVLTGDAAHYGSGTGKHTAMVIGRNLGRVMVVSHGSEGGPYLLPANYRADLDHFRRYI